MQVRLLFRAPLLIRSFILRIFLIFFSVIILGCPAAGDLPVAEINPAAPGFNLAGSDAKAIALADQVMEAMGGRRAWDETQIIAWNFFGRRYLIWNKTTGDVRIDIAADSTVLLTNIFSQEIKAAEKGLEITNPDTLSMLQKRAESLWINDSYWLVMPFKLKDSGVTLSYIGEDTTQAGVPADVLQLTFQRCWQYSQQHVSDLD